MEEKEKTSRRPWEVVTDNWEDWRGRNFPLFKSWLKHRCGIVVYENHLMDSSSFGAQSYTPAKLYLAGSTELQDAPPWISPDGNCSTRQQKVDHITLDEYGGDVDLTLRTCFVPADTSE